MRTRLKLKPGQRGTKKLFQVYGEKLVCVRYRYDEVNKKRYKTVEIIVDEVDWQPPRRYAPEELLKVQILQGELELLYRVKTAGAVWCSKEGAWLMRYQKIAELELEDRIID